METAGNDISLATASVAVLGEQMKLLAQGEALYAAFGGIPDTRLICPQSKEEWEIQTFNMNMQIPNRFETVDQVGDWIKDCAFLNRETVGIFLTEAGHEPVLEYLSHYLASVGDKASLLDNLRLFLGVTGALEVESLESGPEMIKILIEHFAKGFCERNTVELNDWPLVADIGVVLQQLSLRMRNGQPITTLQNFFAEVRALNASQNILPSRVISDLYNEFVAMGPFKRITGRKCADYLMMNPIRCEWMTVFFGFDDSEPRDAWVVVTKTVLYLFVGEEKRPYGCIPLAFVRASLGRLLTWTVELHSFQGNSVPFVKFPSEEYFETGVSSQDILSMPFVSLRIPDQSTDILHSWLDLIESCCWNCRQQDL